MYEYDAVYIIELLILAHYISPISNGLTNQHQLKLKGTRPLEYHLGYDYLKDNTGTLSFGPRNYIQKMIKQYNTYVWT
jgi:hypothetical protein